MIAGFLVPYVGEEYHNGTGSGAAHLAANCDTASSDTRQPRYDKLSPEVSFFRLLNSSVLLAVLIAVFCLPAHTQNTPAKESEINGRQGMPPRASPADYQAQGRAGSVTIGAEFTRHSVPTPEGVYSTEDYVVVETGLFGAPQAHLTISASDFSLRINGKKKLLASQPYELVTASLKDPSWVPPAPPEKSKTSFGSGGQDSGSPPPIVHVPIGVTHAMDQHVEKAVMPEGDRVLPEAGLLFFEYRGKDKNIHSVELSYDGPAGKTKLELEP